MIDAMSTPTVDEILAEIDPILEFDFVAPAEPSAVDTVGDVIAVDECATPDEAQAVYDGPVYAWSGEPLSADDLQTIIRYMVDNGLTADWMVH